LNDTRLKASVPRSGDAARTSACATAELG